MKNKFKIIISTLALAIGSFAEADAQAGNFGTGYFQNQYLLNPAMAGLSFQELNVNSAFNGETAGIDNGAKTLYFTADYGLKENMGLGLGVISDKIGGLSTTRVMATYAYGVKLNSDQSLKFGLSAGGVVERLNEVALNGDLSDVSLYGFNDRRMQFETDLGMAYFNKGFTLQAVAPNLFSTLRDKDKTILTQNTFFASASYKIPVGDDKSQINIEPKVAYRSIKNLDNVIDAGANVDFLQNSVNVYALYHSSKSVTAGVGFKVLDSFQISGSYNSGSADVGGIKSGNTYEIGLRFFTKKK